jgi:PhzF family phenazine biosynthesis protein
VGDSAEVLLVEACLRNGVGGSPTAVVLDGGGLADADLMRIPARIGTSHVAVVYPPGGPGGSWRLRFFTTEGELPGCGHGTVAALAVLAARGAPKRLQLRVAGRDFQAVSETVPGALIEAWFDQGTVEHRSATGDERAGFLAALGLKEDALHPDDEVTVASPGRDRLMIPVLDRAMLAGIRPDQERLSAESRRHGQLGCFVYVPPSATGPAAARMFAPVIGVPEDVANANSSGCLAARLLVTGRTSTVAVDQGDALGRPSTVNAYAVHTRHGIATRVGGVARIFSGQISSDAG